MIQDNEAVAADKGKLRKLIRKKIVEILKNKTDAGERVFPNASIPQWADNDELPAILIYQKSETASKYAEAPRELERDIDFTIEIVAEGPEENIDLNTPAVGQKSLEDILDDIAEQIECEMSRDDALQDTADDSILTNTEFEFESGGSQPIGSARLTYTVTYFTMLPRDTSKQNINLADNKTQQIEYNIGEDENTREATDKVDLPQS